MPTTTARLGPPDSPTWDDEATSGPNINVLTPGHGMDPLTGTAVLNAITRAAAANVRAPESGWVRPPSSAWARSSPIEPRAAPTEDHRGAIGHRVATHRRHRGTDRRSERLAVAWLVVRVG